MHLRVPVALPSRGEMDHPPPTAVARRARARRCPALLLAAMIAACVAAMAAAPAALAHAQLLGTSPAAGATVPAQPREVIFQFNQNVGGTLGAVRVYNAAGEEVDDLDVSHPQGNEHWMGVGLKPGLPDGTYTATYRVISADTHIVYGGFVFSIGHPGAAPRFTVAGLIGKSKSGKATQVAFGAVRALDYLTIALMIGGLAFWGLAWVPGMAAVAGPEPGWDRAAGRFALRTRLLLGTAVLLGIAVSLLGILLQGASAAGVSLWGSLKGTILENTLESRFGWVWGTRALDWLALGALLALAGSLSRRRQRSGASARPRIPPPWLSGLLILGAGYLAVTPALGGHASIQSPTVVFFPADVLHVLGGSIWVGGVAFLLLALPAATAELESHQRSSLLLGALVRFSPVALAAVVAIAVTGVVQAYIDVRSLDALVNTTYGQLLIVKTILLLALMALGWVNRERVIPALTRAATAGSTPGEAGVLARRALRGEMALMLCVFGVTAALVSYAPPIDAASGPFTTNTTLGPALLEMTVEPARVGLNTVHLYLIDAKSGTQYTATKELTAKAELPSKHIGPLTLRVTAAGPGHYILSNAVLSPGGTWHLTIIDRISEFESFSRTIEVPVR